jgi:uncharacterized protein YcfJ
MAKLVFTILLGALSLPVHAQLFSRESMSGAAFGGLLGGIIGHNNGRKTAEGIGIGAGAGLLLGSLAHQSRRHYYYAEPSGYYYSTPHYVYASPAPVYAPPAYRPNYAVTGVALGGVAGGIIGHNNGRKTAEGIAIGAGAGLLLGGLAEYDVRRRDQARSAGQTYYVASPAATQTAPAPAAPEQAAQPVTIINNYYNSSSPAMSGANALFGR